MARKKGESASAQVRYLLRAGLSYAEITVETGIKKSTISFHAKKIGMPGRVKGTGRTVNKECPYCGAENPEKRAYCSTVCRYAHENAIFIQRWKAGG